LRREVEQMVACGMSEDDAARGIGCSTPTLQKYFSEELMTGRAKRRREIISMLFRAARAGNVSAQRKLHDMTSEAAAAEQFFAKPKPVSEPKAEPTSKPTARERAQVESEKAGDGNEWGHLVH